MTPKEMCVFLGRVRNLSRKEQKLRLQIQELRFSLLPSGIRYDKDRVQTSPLDQMLEVLSDIDKIERQRLKVLKVLIDYRALIARKIIILPAKEYYVINQYFLQYKNMREISAELGITERHVYRLKNNAVSMLCKLEGWDE